MTEMKRIKINGDTLKTDVVLSGADYHHSETLLDKNIEGIATHTGIKKFLPLHYYFISA